MDPPTKLTPLHLAGECGSCRGKGCDECRNTGQQTITSCPLAMIDREAQDVMRMAKFAEHGVLPEAGPLNEQREWDVYAIQFAWAELNRAMSERYERDE